MSGSALYSAIPVLKEKLGFSTVEAVWLISAFSLTFASFLLLSGRMSDVFDPSACAHSRQMRLRLLTWPPERLFVCGMAGVGLISLGAGFTNSRIPLVILRALGGCGM
jgi:MFS family permease